MFGNEKKQIDQFLAHTFAGIFNISGLWCSSRLRRKITNSSQDASSCRAEYRRLIDCPVIKTDNQLEDWMRRGDCALLSSLFSPIFTTSKRKLPDCCCLRSLQDIIGTHREPSRCAPDTKPGWRNWQTQKTQNLPVARPWGFDSLSGHQNS